MAGRKYERGENRRKHIGNKPYPVIYKENGEIIGKCPTGMNDEHKAQLLAGAIPCITEQPYSKEFPKRLFVVDGDGTIYAGQTSEAGKSYHGFPYAGPLGSNLKEALRAQAQERGCVAEFEKWWKKHIRDHGKPDI